MIVLQKGKKYMALIATIVPLHLQLSLFANFLQVNPLKRGESREQNVEPDPTIPLSWGVQ